MSKNDAIPTQARLPRRVRRWKVLLLAAALLPVYQVVCIPDVLGALSFETQNLINRVIFQWTSTVVANLFNL